MVKEREEAGTFLAALRNNIEGLQFWSVTIKRGRFYGKVNIGIQ